MNDDNVHKTLELIRLALIGYLTENSGILWKVRCHTDYEDKMPILFTFDALWGEKYSQGCGTQSLSWEDLTPEGKTLPSFVEQQGEEFLAVWLRRKDT